MASYPTSIWTPSTRGTNMSDATTQTDILDAQNAEIVAMQTEEGTAPSGGFSTVKVRFESIAIHQAFTPAGNTDAVVGAAAVDWVNMGNITVPTGTVSATVQMNVSGVYSLVGTSIGIARTSIGTANGTASAIWDTPAVSKRISFSWASIVTAPASGAQALKVRVDNVITSTLRADTTCSFTAVITFRGS